MDSYGTGRRSEGAAAALAGLAVPGRSAVDRANSEPDALVAPGVILRRLTRHRARHTLQAGRCMPHLLQLHTRTQHSYTCCKSTNAHSNHSPAATTNPHTPFIDLLQIHTRTHHSYTCCKCTNAHPTHRPAASTKMHTPFIGLLQLHNRKPHL